MRGGKLDTMIVIQHATVTQSPSGEVIQTWVSLPSRWAAIDSLQGQERFGSAQLVAREQVAFTIRWSRAVDVVTPLDRVICPASVLADSPAQPPRAKIYDIFAVQRVGRYEGLKLLSVVRQDELN